MLGIEGGGILLPVALYAHVHIRVLLGCLQGDRGAGGGGG